MKKVIFIISLVLISVFSNAVEVDSTQIQIDNIEKSLSYQNGIIKFKSGKGKLIVPKGFKFLDKSQSQYVLSDLWGNPIDNSVLGLLVPENKGVLGDGSWVFTISYEAIGYVEDDDASDIDYDDLLKEQQKETKEGNPERIKEGYQPIKLLGWASNPFYDEKLKVLHWAKELKFGKDAVNTLNYNLRILGRKGMFVLNAIATTHELKEVKASIPKVISSIKFEKGYTYADFNEDKGDHIAEWTIGGLVAGKILAKVGFWVLLVKFWKILALAVVGAGSFVWKKIKRKKETESIQKTEENTSNDDN